MPLMFSHLPNSFSTNPLTFPVNPSPYLSNRNSFSTHGNFLNHLGDPAYSVSTSERKKRNRTFIDPVSEVFWKIMILIVTDPNFCLFIHLCFLSWSTIYDWKGVFWYFTIKICYFKYPIHCLFNKNIFFFFLRFQNWKNGLMKIPILHTHKLINILNSLTLYHTGIIVFPSYTHTS